MSRQTAPCVSGGTNLGEVGDVLLGGVWIDDGMVQRLIAAVQHKALARKLSMAYRLRSPVLNLTIAERHTISAVLEEQPSGLEALRERLLADEAWLLRERV